MVAIKLSQVFSNCIKFSSRRFHLGVQKMQNAYFRRLNGAEQFQLSFQFKLLGVDRQFNFNRQVSENVNDLIRRIQGSLGKMILKHKKKKKNKKQNQDSEEEHNSEIPVELLCDGEPVLNTKQCRDVLFGNGKLCLRIFETDYNVVINAPWVNVITLPVSIMAGFPTYPNKFESVFAVKDYCHFSWHRSNAQQAEPSTWLEVGTGYYYTPTVDDIGFQLKLRCVPGNGSIQGPSTDVISKNCVEAGPGHCPFEIRHSFTKKRLDGQSFRVVSYNILADLYADSEVAHNQLYPYCPPYALNMDYRKQLIFKELLGYNADMICLQEVDSKIFTFDLQPVLSSVGYEGIFEKKGGQVSEGLACFYHTSKFRLLKSHNICLAEELKCNPIFSEVWSKVQNNEPLIKRFLGRTTSVHVTVFECVSQPGKALVVANTHLYFHPDADHIRLLQAGMAVLYIKDIIDQISSEFPDTQFSTIICGDYNSTPECGVYQLMTTQFVPDDCIDWHSNEAEAVKDVSLSHSLSLASAYGTPEFTNFTAGFSGCLDYIFYQTSSFIVTQVVPLPSVDELNQHTALPSIVFPSDHVALVADLSWSSK